MTKKHRERRCGRETGVTLLETMVTITIAVVLLSLGIPGLSDFVRNTRRDSRVVDVVVTLNLARSEAVKRNHHVTVCPSLDGLNCSGNFRWESGWIVFGDPNNNGTVDGTETVLHRYEALGGEATLRTGHNRTRVTYQGTGFSIGFNTTLRFCDSRGTDYARSVIVSNAGRARVASSVDVCP